MQETRLIDSPNPTHSLLAEYRADNPPSEQSPASRCLARNGAMKILVGFSGVLLCIFLLTGSHGQQVTEDSTSSSQLSTRTSEYPQPTLPSIATTRRTPGRGCSLPSSSTLQKLAQSNANLSDTCLPGYAVENCQYWRMINAVLLKVEEDVDMNVQMIQAFINNTSASCNYKSQIEYLFSRFSGVALDNCKYVYNFNTPPLRRAMANFNNSRTLVKDIYKNQPGAAMYEFLQTITDCMNAKPLTDIPAGVLNIFTDLTFIDLCESDALMAGFNNILNKYIDSGYVVKFIFLNENLKNNQKIVEAVLQGCKYRVQKSFCEIFDLNVNQLNSLNDFSICLTTEEKTKSNNQDLNWQLILIIGIPCLSLTICCIAFFICFLKCAQLKIAMMRMRIFGNDDPRTPEEMNLKRKWFGKHRGKDMELGSCKEINSPTWSHFASANNYMDIQALANANKKDVWEIDTKNLLVQEDHLLGNGAFANVYKGIVKGKIPLFVVNNSLNMVVESENNGHFEAAVKKLPAHADDQNHLDFFHEIEFMKRLGHHPHVISMLGCVSNPYEPLIVVEYCQRGDLLKFLRRHKDYVLMNKTDDCPVEADMCLRIKDLVSIAWQVADGMSYMASKNFIHRDLAARNILLTKSLTAKISDFGLCRYMDSALYTAKGGRLPIKWMSIEALKLYEFSSKSDVWSFGVLLYEIFSMGDVPYPTVQQVDMLEHLLAGGRLAQPLKCPNEIYNIMKKCWAENPDDRPEFNEIRGEVSVMLNLDDESYGYLSVQSDDGLPKYTSLTMQDSKESVPCSSPAGSLELDDDYDSEEDEHHDKSVCQKLDQVLSERYGVEQSNEIRQIFCEVKEQMERPKRTKSQNSHSTNRS